MTWDHVTIERHDAVALVRFSRPDCRNALSLALIGELTAAARQVAGDDGVRAVVLAGGGGVFSAGLDLRDENWDPATPATTEEVRRRWQRGTEMCAAWEAVPQPTVAAIEGYAIGGGMVLALAFDWRVLGRGAFLTLPEIRIGLSLGWGALPRLTALLGPARAKRAAILCERITADRAETWGLVDDVAEDGGAEAAALAMAAAAAAMPVGPTRMAKATVNAVAHALLPLAAHRDGDQAALSLQAPEFAATIAAFARR
jgi:enoyl-CoA hydratase/carnithine racemase